jgi:hypothetical protein
MLVVQSAAGAMTAPVPIYSAAPPPHVVVAHTAARRLASLVKPDGSFVYRYDAARLRERSGYNILRHAGSLWALEESSRHLTLSTADRDAARRSMIWLIEHRLQRTPDGTLCMVEDGKIKLGGAGLATLAILASLATNLQHPPEDRERLADAAGGLCGYMLSQITSDGDFIHKRDAATGEIEPFRSDYYTGEALFALIEAQRQWPDQSRLSVARELLNGLAERDYGVDEQSQWMMYAAETSWMLRPDAALLRYMDRVVDNILDRAFYRDRNFSTPIACRSEGLLCALRTWQRSGTASGPRFARVADEVSVNLSLQLRDYLPDGAFCRGAGQSTVRIDFIQHNLSAFLGYSILRQ